MEEGGESGAVSKQATPEGNPNPAPAPSPPPTPPSADAAAAPRSASRTPFTSLGQVDADYALARILQDQERAYARLTSNGFYYESSYDGSYDEEEDEDSEWNEQEYTDREDGGSVEGSDFEENASDANGPNTDRAEFDNNDALARLLGHFDERMAPLQLLPIAELRIWLPDGDEDRGSNSQDVQQEIDPDDHLYEELIALGEVVGTESRGLPTDTIAALPTVNYKAENAHDDNIEQCVICRLDYKDGDSLVLLSCKHKYHSECINKWLQINKVCPVCIAEVST